MLLRLGNGQFGLRVVGCRMELHVKIVVCAETVLSNSVV